MCLAHYHIGLCALGCAPLVTFSAMLGKDWVFSPSSLEMRNAVLTNPC